MNRILLEIRMLNILLLRSQKEMRNMLVNTRGRVMLVTKNLPELCSSVGWKVEFVNEEHGYLVEEGSKQSVKQ